jgi:hypothetical protein
MKRNVYPQDRATLDQPCYWKGFVHGYQNGTQAACEFIECGFFEDSYEDHHSPEPPPFSEKLAYQIGYSDAYDLGFKIAGQTLETGSGIFPSVTQYSATTMFAAV